MSSITNVADRRLVDTPFEGPRAEAHELEFDVVDGVIYVHFIAGGKQYSLASRAPHSVLAKQAVFAIHGVQQHMEKMSDPVREHFNHTVRNSVVTVTPRRDGIYISEKSATYGIPGTRHYESLGQGELIGLADKTQKNLDKYASLFRLVPRGFRPIGERAPRPVGEEVTVSGRTNSDEVVVSARLQPKSLGQRVKEVTVGAVTAATNATRVAAEMLTMMTPDSNYGEV